MVPRPVSPALDGPLIPQFFAGRSVFITGATGFMGKVLLERLLWTCPDVGSLFLLMRHKKDVPPEKRLAQLKSSQVFDVIRQNCPHQLDKLRAVPGDTMQPNLGMDPQSMALLQQVSIVFHSAATLKFDEALEVAVDQNVRSVIRVLDICDQLPNIAAFIHVSTAYGNAELSYIEERIYPSATPLQQVLTLSSIMPSSLLAQVTPGYIAPKPNTYTFTKALAEIAIEEHKDRSYPVAIFRPTIVVSSLRHPFPGWIENLNGPSGIIVAAGKGLLHVFCCKETAKGDLLPVDIAIDTLLAVAWETATERNPNVKVYNCSTSDNPTTWRKFENALRKHLVEHPLDNTFWYPSGSSVEGRVAQKSLEFCTQTLPLHIAEYTLRLLGIKTRLSLITVSQRLAAMTDVLRFFSVREWQFNTDNVKKLLAKMTPQDRNIYNLDVQTIDWNEHYENFVKGTRKYLLKEKDQDIVEARRHVRKMYYVHNGVLLFIVILLCRLSLSNQFVRSLVYGTLRLLISLFNSAYMRIVK